jgi:hypothetical protein
MPLPAAPSAPQEPDQAHQDNHGGQHPRSAVELIELLQEQRGQAEAHESTGADLSGSATLHGSNYAEPAGSKNRRRLPIRSQGIRRLDRERSPRGRHGRQEADAQDGTQDDRSVLQALSGDVETHHPDQEHCAERNTPRGLKERRTEDGCEHVPTIRSQCSTDPNLPRSLRHGERHHRVKAAPRQKQGQTIRERDERHEEAIESYFAAQGVTQTQRVVQAKQRIHVGYDALEQSKRLVGGERRMDGRSLRLYHAEQYNLRNDIRVSKERAIMPPRNPEDLLPLSPQVFAVLISIGTRAMHGYAMMQEIERRTQNRETPNDSAPAADRSFPRILSFVRDPRQWKQLRRLANHQ